MDDSWPQQHTISIWLPRYNNNYRYYYSNPRPKPKHRMTTKTTVTNTVHFFCLGGGGVISFHTSSYGYLLFIEARMPKSHLIVEHKKRKQNCTRYTTKYKNYIPPCICGNELSLQARSISWNDQEQHRDGTALVPNSNQQKLSSLQQYTAPDSISNLSAYISKAKTK